MKCIAFILLSIIISTKTIAQSGVDDDFPDFSKLGDNQYEKKPQVEDISLKLVDSASRAICEKDTNLAIHYLKTYFASPTKNFLKEVARYKTGILYTQTHQLDSAIKVYKELLVSEKETEGGYYLYEGKKDTCTLILRCYGCGSEGGIPFNTCLKLSDLFIKNHNFIEALNYLTYAETKYRAYNGGCANGYYLYQGQLNLKFANLYLLKGDTGNAIKKLFTCILDREGYPQKAIQMLRGILYSKYTNKQIIKQIDNSISSLKKVKYEEDERAVLDLFGQKLIWVKGYSLSVDELKKQLMDDECFNDLKKITYTPKY